MECSAKRSERVVEHTSKFQPSATSMGWVKTVGSGLRFWGHVRWRGCQRRGEECGFEVKICYVDRPVVALPSEGTPKSEAGSVASFNLLVGED